MRSNPLSRFWADLLGRPRQRRLLDRPDRRRRGCALGFSLLTVVLGFVYLLWLTPLVFKNRGIPDFLFLAAETLSFLLLTLMAVDVWQLRGHRPEGLSPDRPWPVDIFVPCCGEPLEVITTTLRAVQRINYQPLEVYVLDDGASRQWPPWPTPWDFITFLRPSRAAAVQDSKSGNLNFGLHTVTGI